MLLKSFLQTLGAILALLVCFFLFSSYAVFC